MVEAVTTVQIANPPLAIVEEHCGMHAARVVVLDRDFALFGPADSEWARECERAVSRAKTYPQRRRLRGCGSGIHQFASYAGGRSLAVILPKVRGTKTSKSV